MNILLALFLTSFSSTQAQMLNVNQVTKLMDVSVLIRAKESIPNESGDTENHMLGCSGTFVGDNEVLTAAHCFHHPVVGAWIRTPKGDSHVIDKVLKISYGKDLALVHVVGPKHVSAKLAVHNPQKGENVYNVGSPYFLEFLVSDGIIGALNVKVHDFTSHYFMSTAMINPGSSGGGAFNDNGELIGVNTLTIGGPFGWAGITLSVSLDDIKEFVRDVE